MLSTFFYALHLEWHSVARLSPSRANVFDFRIRENYLHHKLISTCNRMQWQTFIYCPLSQHPNQNIHSIFLPRLFSYSNIFHAGIDNDFVMVYIVGMLLHLRWCPLENHLFLLVVHLKSDHDAPHIFTNCISIRMHSALLNNNHIPISLWFWNLQCLLASKFQDFS